MSISSIEHLERADAIAVEGGVATASPEHAELQRLLAAELLAAAREALATGWADDLEAQWMLVATTVTRFVFAELHTPVLTRSRRSA